MSNLPKTRKEVWEMYLEDLQDAKEDYRHLFNRAQEFEIKSALGALLSNTDEQISAAEETLYLLNEDQM